MTWSMPSYTAPDFTLPLFTDAPDVTLVPAPRDGVAPDRYHSMSIFPEYFKVHGTWLLAEESRMDCVPVYAGGRIAVVEFRNLKKGDLVVVGRKERGEEGIYVHDTGFSADREDTDDSFIFRTGRSRETAYSKDYDSVYELLEYEKQHGKIVWVMGPACAFDADARAAFADLVRAGYVDGLMAGNALATHDLEAAYLGTALGQDVYTQKLAPLGHYNHLDTINKVRQYGSIHTFIEKEKLDNGIIAALDRCHIPFVLAGSIRDDGPLPEVIGNVYEAQNAMRDMIRNATTVICMATMLHSIATGNMFPSYRVVDGHVRPTYFYCVDISEFAVNKLRDRGSLSVSSIVTNVQDFVVNVRNNLCR
ncbi:hypothetical protein [Megasphaera hominis]|jgi:lysine-ketoglutarate reductase/saccharopine dehydrogenase-like protein (TIGR00300 family)|uniref:Arginine dihydrolase ArgZ/ArgE-like C-terminal second subdomain domain-containing protein n=1 Tax=Megasphaera hominis TaxID=159836 RepID=A0ABR6VIE1_9FIRM|nr:hypothetical protein [Megasphaera hominis]MBC3536858.1 hypothetical protein [Megasphaera hominis]